MNVVFVLLDTTRRDHVAPFGDLVFDQTVARLAAGGVRFDQAAPVPAATASAGLPVSYSTGTPGTCSVTSGGVITLLAVGDFLARPHQLGDVARDRRDPDDRV